MIHEKLASAGMDGHEKALSMLQTSCYRISSAQSADIYHLVYLYSPVTGLGKLTKCRLNLINSLLSKGAALHLKKFNGTLASGDVEHDAR